jgi:hypothetical protein
MMTASGETATRQDAQQKFFFFRIGHAIPSNADRAGHSAR